MRLLADEFKFNYSFILHEYYKIVKGLEKIIFTLVGKKSPKSEYIYRQAVKYKFPGFARTPSWE